MLDEYERTRRPLNIKYVQEQTVANKKRLEEREPAQREKRFDELRAMADDPQAPQGVPDARFAARALLRGAARDASR